MLTVYEHTLHNDMPLTPFDADKDTYIDAYVRYKSLFASILICGSFSSLIQYDLYQNEDGTYYISWWGKTIKMWEGDIEEVLARAIVMLIYHYKWCEYDAYIKYNVLPTKDELLNNFLFECDLNQFGNSYVLSNDDLGHKILSVIDTFDITKLPDTKNAMQYLFNICVENLKKDPTIQKYFHRNNIEQASLINKLSKEKLLKLHLQLSNKAKRLLGEKYMETYNSKVIQDIESNVLAKCRFDDDEWYESLTYKTAKDIENLIYETPIRRHVIKRVEFATSETTEFYTCTTIGEVYSYILPKRLKKFIDTFNELKKEKYKKDNQEALDKLKEKYSSDDDTNLDEDTKIIKLVIAAFKEYQNPKERFDDFDEFQYYYYDIVEDVANKMAQYDAIRLTKLFKKQIKDYRLIHPKLARRLTTQLELEKTYSKSPYINAMNSVLDLTLYDDKGIIKNFIDNVGEASYVKTVLKQIFNHIKYSIKFSNWQNWQIDGDCRPIALKNIPTFKRISKFKGFKKINYVISSNLTNKQFLKFINFDILKDDEREYINKVLSQIVECMTGKIIIDITHNDLASSNFTAKYSTKIGWELDKLEKAINSLMNDPIYKLAKGSES